MKKILLVIIVIFLGVPAQADQPEWMVRGKVLEKGTRKPLVGITLNLSGQEDSAISGDNGYFVFVLHAPGSYMLNASGPGYSKSDPEEVFLRIDEKIANVTLYLEPILSLPEVIIEEDRNKDKTAKMVVTGKELLDVPGSAGDPLRGMQALPGITTLNDASSNPAIRGSRPEDNAYYVDFLPVGYVFHMGGMESVFNADLVDNFNIYTAAFGPEFTDVTGGVIDVQLRRPRTDRIGAKVNVSMLEADVVLEGPLSQNKSFYIAARRSYIDLIMSNYHEQHNGVEFRQYPRFYDYQGKYIWSISPDQTLTLQASGARDEMKLTLTTDNLTIGHDPILAGDATSSQEYHQQGLIIDSRISPRVANRLGIAHLSTTFETQMTQLGHADVTTDTYMLRNHQNITIGNTHDLLLGVDYRYNIVKLNIDIPKAMPSEFTPPPDYTSSDRYTNNDTIYYSSLELAIKDRWKILDNVTLVLGGHATYEDYFNRSRFEPRVSTEYYVTKSTLITAGWGKYHQVGDGHEIINNGGNPKLGYIEADHYVVGMEQQLNDGWSAKVEGYYKDLEKLVVPQQPDNYVNAGSGKAYGAEILIKKKRTGDWAGWLAAGYSKTVRHNNLTGENFASIYDQPFIINLVYEWYFAPKWIFGARWRYQTGAPITPVVATYTDSTGRLRPVYGSLGSERLPDYHRLDLRIKRDFLFNTCKMSTYVDVINAYNHENVSGYEYNADFSSKKSIDQLPFLLSLGIQVEF